MAMERHTISVGDTLTPVAAQLKQKNDSGVLTPVVLTGLDVKFQMVDSYGTSVVAETTVGVTVNDESAGKVQYDFQAADVDTAGVYYAWFTVYSGSERDTFPAGGRKFLIEILDRK